MVRVKPFRVISLRRVLLGAAGLAGAALTLRLAVGAALPAPDGRWADIAGLTRLFGGSAAQGQTGAGGAGQPVAAYGMVTVIVAPRDAGLAATLFRDGVSAGRFEGGPLTVAVHAGDVLTVGLGRGAPDALVRVLAVSGDVAAPGPQAIPLAAGGTVSLGPVRLGSRPPSG